jgi:hypothetical protein
MPLQKPHLPRDYSEIDFGVPQAQIQKEVSGVAVRHDTAQHVAGSCDRVSLSHLVISKDISHRWDEHTLS